MIHIDKLYTEMSKNRGVRVGETAVVSKKVHSVDPNKPEEVHIITNSDAGQVFYNRYNKNEIVHIDIFHEVSTFDHIKLADYLKKSMMESKWQNLMDYMDIQTGSGGGRLTGNLNYGMSESLRKDHLNHIHMAALVADDQLDVVFFLVDKIEEALQHLNVELRKVEKIINEVGNSPMDMSPYASDSDSNLRQSILNIENSKIQNDAINLIEHFASLREIEEILETLQRDKTSMEDLNNLKRNCGDLDEIIKHLERNNFVRKYSTTYRLTKEGVRLKEYFRMNRMELELILKKSIKNIPKFRGNKGFDLVYTANKTKRDNRGIVTLENFNPLDWIEEFDINETIKNSLTRCYYQKQEFSIIQDDIKSIRRIPKVNQDICLIIDASASMAGNRIRNAKFLAKHLILNSKRRVSVMAFQDREVKLYVPFTRNFSALDAGLNEIFSTGLTPLALALEKGLSHIASTSVKNPLIILITDGIPTIALWTSDPIKDAVKAASKIAQKKVNFCCIGLQPNKDCLMNVTKAARGKLFIVDELNRECLVNVTKKSGQLI